MAAGLIAGIAAAAGSSIVGGLQLYQLQDQRDDIRREGEFRKNLAAETARDSLGVLSRETERADSSIVAGTGAAGFANSGSVTALRDDNVNLSRLQQELIIAGVTRDAKVIDRQTRSALKANRAQQISVGAGIALGQTQTGLNLGFAAAGQGGF